MKDHTWKKELCRKEIIERKKEVVFVITTIPVQPLLERNKNV
jgi:hypothetical protein